MKVYITSFVLFCCLIQQGFAGNPNQKYTRQEYIETWKRIAVENMNRYRIPASIILAQGILESGCGNSELASVANNHFGIKCHDWVGDKYYYDDDAKQECFRKYESAAQSYTDHAEFLTKRPRYAFLFQLDPKDYKGWALGLKKAGYATNPAYPELLVKIIEESRLQVYDSGINDDLYPEKKEEPIVMLKKHNKKPELNRSRGEEVTIFLDREVLLSDNRIKYIESRPGDSPQKLAKELEMGLWQVLKYNDIDKTARLEPGSVIYLQPKRKKAKIERHTIKHNESLWDISQLYGIKLSRIYKLNKLEENSVVPEGFVVKLR